MTDLSATRSPVRVGGSGESTLWVDDRLAGRHGIGRFADETVRRLTVPHRALTAVGVPTRPLDVLSPARLRLPPRDLVYTPGFNAGITRARQVLTLHDLIHLQVPDERSRLKTLYYERIVRPAVLAAGVVVTVSQTSAAVLTDWLDDERVKIVDVGNGVSDAFFASHPPAAEPSTLRMLYVGNLKPHKSPEVAFDVLRRLPAARLTVVSSDVVGVHRLASERGVEGRVSVLPNCGDDELVRLYATHSCLILPSRLEGFGLPAAEAGAMGCPVVHRRSCASVAEIVAGRGEGVDSDDVAEWAAAVELVAGRPRPDPPRDWHERYSWAAVGRRLDAALTGLLAP